MGGVPFLGVYLSVEPMIFTPVHPILKGVKEKQKMDQQRDQPPSVNSRLI